MVDRESRREQDYCWAVNEILKELENRGFHEVYVLKYDDPDIYAEMHNSLTDIVKKVLP